MEQLVKVPFPSPLTFLLFLIVGIIILFVIITLLKKGHKAAQKREVDFQCKYNELQSMINAEYRTFEAETIRKKLKELSDTHWNSEKVNVLTWEFLRKFYPINN